MYENQSEIKLIEKLKINCYFVNQLNGIKL